MQGPARGATVKSPPKHATTVGLCIAGSERCARPSLYVEFTELFITSSFASKMDNDYFLHFPTTSIPIIVIIFVIIIMVVMVMIIIIVIMAMIIIIVIIFS